MTGPEVVSHFIIRGFGRDEWVCIICWFRGVRTSIFGNIYAREYRFPGEPQQGFIEAEGFQRTSDPDISQLSCIGQTIQHVHQFHHFQYYFRSNYAARENHGSMQTIYSFKLHLLHIHRALPSHRSSPSPDALPLSRTSVISNHDATPSPHPGPRGPNLAHLSSKLHCRNQAQHLQPPRPHHHRRHLRPAVASRCNMHQFRVGQLLLL